MKEQIITIFNDVLNNEKLNITLSTDLYDSEIIDSLKTVELIVAFCEKLNIDISPLDFDPLTQWRTLADLITDIENRAASI